MPEEKVTPQSLAKSVMEQVFGNSGTQVFNGFFTEEPNEIFRDQNRITTIETMRRTDGAIKAVLNAIKSPMLSTGWRVEGGDDDVRDFVEDCLFHMEGRSWKEFLREALAYLDFGHYTFELIWRVEKDGIKLIDLSPRIPHSILRWKLDNQEPGIVQFIRNDETKDKITAQIPMDKLLVLTNDKEGSDYTGQSILRAAYKHFQYKDVIYRIQGIAAERYGVGIPIIYMPAGFDDSDKAAAEELLQNVRSNEKSYIVMPWSKSSGAEIDILTPKSTGQANSLEQAADHHNKMITMSVLANFLGLGTDGTGSLALSQDQTSFFLKHVEDKADYLAEQINKQVIKKIVELNFGEVDDMPHLSYEPLGDIDFAEYSGVVNTLTTAGYASAQDPRMVQFVHKMFKFPEITEDEMQAMEQAKLEAEMAASEQQIQAEYNMPDEPIDNGGEKEDDVEEEPEEKQDTKPVDPNQPQK